jgi:uncharacterized membrane protein
VPLGLEAAKPLARKVLTYCGFSLVVLVVVVDDSFLCFLCFVLTVVVSVVLVCWQKAGMTNRKLPATIAAKSFFMFPLDK